MLDRQFQKQIEKEAQTLVYSIRETEVYPKQPYEINDCALDVLNEAVENGSITDEYARLVFSAIYRTYR